jgi:hypothetical protein
VGRILSNKDLEIVDLRGRINSLEIIGKRAEDRIRELEAAILVHRQQEPNCRCGFELVLPSNTSDTATEPK